MKSSLRKADFISALKILGPNRVLTDANVGKIWNHPSSHAHVRYYDKTLRLAHSQNRKGKADWRLIHIIGLTLLEQRTMPGRVFCSENEWYLSPEEEYWFECFPKEQAGNYCLINFKPSFLGQDHEEQEENILQLGPLFARTNLHVFSEAVISVGQYQQEKLAADWHHVSDFTSSGDLPVLIGCNDANGLHIGRLLPGKPAPNFGVSISRQWDF